MTVLISPKGDRYVTDDPREITNLTLGHGYRYADTDPHRDAHEPIPEAGQPEPSQPPSQPATGPITEPEAE